MEKRIRQFTVLVNEDNLRLDEFLAIKIGRFSRSMANNCIKAGAVSIEPYRMVKPALKVHTGDIVSLSQTMSGDTPMYDEVVILDETPDFWVFSKPAGMAVHPTANIYHNTVTRYVETVLKAQGFVVHRLDKETSGVLIMAKSPDVSRELDVMFQSRNVIKQYEAVVYNADAAFFPGKQLNIDIPLGFAGLVLPRITMGIGNLEAHTHIECTAIHSEFAWLKVDLHSGRQHQIRVHLALNHTPIIGDKLYLFGESFYKSYLDREETPMFTPHRHLLHAAHLELDWKTRHYTWDAPVPDLMRTVFMGDMVPAYFPTDYSKLFLMSEK
ncbi:MAG: RluA family pseudouridine synthase [Proteobacteria bacterium]|nr:RluA family pseudouridine synthase [Pseudomonadota bacterium]